MKSNIYYFDEPGKQEANQEMESYKAGSKKQINNNIPKLQNKSYMNIFFYIWLLVCAILISIYIILYNSNKYNNNKKLYKSKQTLSSQNKTIVKEKDLIKKENALKNKKGIAFVFTNKLINEIEELLLSLANKLIKDGKYEIYLITKKDYNLNIPVDKKIKIFRIMPNKTEIERFDEKTNIKYYILNNDLSSKNIIWYKSLNKGKKVIGIMENIFLSYIYSNSTSTYLNWKNSMLYDAFINIAPDDYYIYKKLGMNNTFYIPYFYNFVPMKVTNSNLTYKNIMIIGREKDILKGGVYGIKAMSLIVESIPNAKLYLISSSYHIEFLEDLIEKFDLEKNVEVLYGKQNVTSYYLNSSILLYPSISESYSYLMNEAKAHAIPIIAFNLSYNPAYQNGVILVNQFDYKQMAKEAIKLLNNYNYRKIKGLEAKLSLFENSDRETFDKWEKLFSLLDKNNTEELQKFQNETYNLYYSEKKAKEILGLEFKSGIEYNKFFSCHSFNNMININYLNNISPCKNTS